MAEKEKYCFVFVRPEVSIEECRSFLKLDPMVVSDGEVKEVIDLLINLVEIDFRNYLTKQERKIIPLNKEKDNKENAA